MEGTWIQALHSSDELCALCRLRTIRLISPLQSRRVYELTDLWLHKPEGQPIGSFERSISTEIDKRAAFDEPTATSCFSRLSSPELGNYHRSSRDVKK